MAALGVEIAEEAFLPAAEREERHWGGDADIDADVAGPGLIAELAGGRAAAREKTGLVAVAAVIDQGDGFFDRLRVHQAEDGTEDLGLGDLAGWVHVVQEGREDEVTALIAADLLAATVDHRLDALCRGLRNQLLDPGFALCRDDGAHLHAGIQPAANP